MAKITTLEQALSAVRDDGLALKDVPENSKRRKSALKR